MPYITMEEIETLIEIENHLGDTENWSIYTTKIWELIEKLMKRHKKETERGKLIMREKRKIDKNYGREKARKNGKE